MARRSIEERVSARLRSRATAWQAIEAQLAGKTLEEHFREQAELIDERFAVRDAKWDARFRRIEQDIGTLKGDVGTLKGDVGVLKKNMVIVREGIAILLKRG
jgi:hypothetical protein